MPKPKFDQDTATTVGRYVTRLISEKRVGIALAAIIQDYAITFVGAPDNDLTAAKSAILAKQGENTVKNLKRMTGNYRKNPTTAFALVQAAIQMVDHDFNNSKLNTQAVELVNTVNG